MIKSYNIFNESINSKKARKKTARSFRHGNMFGTSVQKENEFADIQLPLRVSNRLKFIITKMSETGNPLSKEILKSIEDNRLVKISYLDLSRTMDMITYTDFTQLSKMGVRPIDDEPYKMKGRPSSKIYKVMRIIFDNKYTKKEIEKFVSLYKSVYAKGPDKTLVAKEDISPIKLNASDMANKLVEDTLNGKIKWKSLDKGVYLNRYNADIILTPKKKIEIEFYLFPLDVNSFVSFNLSKDVSKDGIKNARERIFLKSINFSAENLLDVLNKFKEYFSKNG